MQSIEISADVSAPPQQVFDLYTDHEGWPRWAGIKEVVLRQQGDPAPNGVGAIRVVRQSGMAVEEEITAFEPPKRMEYRLTGGAPIRDHRGEVLFEPSGEGTRVIWRIQFRPLIPGTGFLIRLALERAVSPILGRLADAFSGH